jgi:hypothetical protein
MCQEKHCLRPGCEKHVPVHRNDGFCSFNCKKTHEIMQFRKTQEQYSELPLVKAPVVSKIKICLADGCENIVKKRGKAAKYCSQKCFHESKRKYHIIPCENPGCKKPFQSGRFNKRFCSRECFHIVIKSEKNCANQECQKLFTPEKRSSKYCCRACFDAVRGKNILHYDVCQFSNCGKKLSAEQRERHQKFCSVSCSFSDRKEKMGTGIGKITFRKEKGWVYPRRFIKTEKGWILLSRYTWEQVNGPLPKHHIVVCKDGNTFNDDDISNLEIAHVSKALLAKSIRKTEKVQEESQESFDIKEYAV